MMQQECDKLVQALNSIELIIARSVAIGIASTLYSSKDEMEACAQEIVSWLFHVDDK